MGVWGNVPSLRSECIAGVSCISYTPDLFNIWNKKPKGQGIELRTHGWGNLKKKMGESQILHKNRFWCKPGFAHSSHEKLLKITRNANENGEAITSTVYGHVWNEPRIIMRGMRKYIIGTTVSLWRVLSWCSSSGQAPPRGRNVYYKGFTENKCCSDLTEGVVA